MKKPKKKLRILIVLFLLLLLFAAGGLAVIYSAYQSTLQEMFIPKEENPDSKKEVKEKPVLENPFAILMYGIDQRPDTHDAGRPDTLMLALVDPLLLKVQLISIPRDSYVSIPGYREKDKINSTYPRGGAELTMQTIEEWFDTELYGYVHIDFDGFTELVDLLGGVEVYVDQKIVYDDPMDGTHIRLEQGLQVLDGKNALDFVRARKDNRGSRYYTSDYQRMERQQLVLKTLAGQIVSFQSIPKILDMMGVLGDNVKTSLTPKELDYLIRIFYKFDISNLATTSVQSSGLQLNGVWYEEVGAEEVQRITQLISDFMTRQPTTPVESGELSNEDQDQQSESATK